MTNNNNNNEEFPHAVSGAQDANNARLKIKVVSSTGKELYFILKKTTKFQKLQEAYASLVAKEVSDIRLLYEGQYIRDDDTPGKLGMEDGDAIDAYDRPGGVRCEVCANSGKTNGSGN